MRGSGYFFYPKGLSGMTSERCSEDRGQSCRGATQPKLRKVQRQAMHPTGPIPSKQEPTA